MIDPINDELSKLNAEDCDKALDAISSGLQKAGHPLCSIKAMKHINSQDGQLDGICKCGACSKHFVEDEWTDGDPCPSCGEL